MYLSPRYISNQKFSTFASSILFLEFLLFYFVLFYFLLFRATPAAYGSSQARNQIGATAAGLHHSHSNTGSKLHLQPTPQLMAMLDSLVHWVRPGIEPASLWILVRFITTEPQRELADLLFSSPSIEVQCWYFSFLEVLFISFSNLPILFSHRIIFFSLLKSFLINLFYSLACIVLWAELLGD